jgi:predicted patatin/cPLA2 family phospholipase
MINQTNQTELICRQTAIVTEGGGQRGIFTAGVLDSFSQVGFNPFGIGIGTSAGAQNLFTYFVGLPGYAKRAIAELTHSPNIFVPYRWLGGRNVLDLDTYFHRMLNDPEYRLPYQQITEVSKKRSLLFVATRKSDLAATYLEPESHTVVDYMKASSAVPFLYKEGVEVNNEILVDGGVADPIPVRKAYEQGARRILVIRTIPEEHEKSCWRQRIEALRLNRALPMAVLKMIERHEEVFEDALSFMLNPPDDLDLIQIAPAKPLQSSVFGSRSAALLADYGTGIRAGELALEKLFNWQERKNTNVSPAIDASLSSTACL